MKFAIKSFSSNLVFNFLSNPLVNISRKISKSIRSKILFLNNKSQNHENFLCTL